MQIIQETSTGRVQYLFNDDDRVIINVRGLKVNGSLISRNTKHPQHKLVRGVEQPPVFVGNGLMWDGTWSVVDQGAIDAEVARQAQELINVVTEATQQRLDDFAKTRNYDGILSAATYATSTNPKFAAEGQYCVTARDNTWATLYTIMAEVEAGTRPMPTSFADIEPDLPVLTWPTT